MEHPKIVFLDWSGTISGSKFWGHLEDPKHPNHEIYSKTQKFLFEENRHLLDPWMRGLVTSENILNKIAEDTEISFDVLLEEFVNSCIKMKYSTDRFIKLIAQIRHLGIRVVIATDNMDSFPRWTVTALGLEKIFDDILDSYTLKVLKRDFDAEGTSLFFSDYLHSVDISPRDCLLIDDSEDKGNKIQNYGIEYHRIEPIVGLEPELISIINKQAKQP